MAELIRGKSGRVFGHLFGLLSTMKSLPLAYNKDLQEDKEGVFDTVKTILPALRVFNGMLSTVKVKKDNMYKATTHDFSNATELADYLATKGIPFRQAHGIVGELVLKGIQSGQNLQDISMADFKKISPLIEEDVYEVLKPEVAVERRNSYGGTGFKQVREQIKKAQEELGL
jgi:argininosuccinate lyase